MKKLISYLLLIACTIGSFEKNLGAKKDIWESIINRYNQACKIEYIREPKGQDYWQLPWETKILQKGDCEDKAFYLEDLLWGIGINARTVIGNYRPKKINSQGEEGVFCHAWVEFDHNNKFFLSDPSEKYFNKKSRIPKGAYEEDRRFDDKLMEFYKTHY